MAENKMLFDELGTLTTEKRNKASMEIDSSSTAEILRIINAEDKKVAFAVEEELQYIGQAVDIVTAAFKRGGRLFYVGAGTSGRIGMQDAVE
ncbi:MAG TPA: N-acetylmuramic acid 6-phosphate etherase, partial [Candidatus Kryptobacter bacterium]|nr:N-acetylmuramic acid 6-phosphate etherase [Candidatus Kryptobacter bacterium]